MAWASVSEATWSAAVVTGATFFGIQNTGNNLLLVDVQADSGAAAPSAGTSDDGFAVQPGQLLNFSGLAAHTLYVCAPNGPTTYELVTDGT